MKTSKSQSPIKVAVGRVAPQIDATLQPLPSSPDIFNDPEVVIRDCTIENLILDGLPPKSVLFENCILKRMSFARTRFVGLRLKDVRLLECDFANAEAARLIATRVEFVNCRLTGLRAIECQCQHLLISEGDAGFCQFRQGTFKTTEFSSCNFGEADFQDADLRGAILKGCDFRNAEMNGAKLEGADFRGSRVEGMLANAADLRGAIVDPAQAMVFAALFGLIIR